MENNQNIKSELPLNTKISDLTIEQFLELQNTQIPKYNIQGIKGLAKLLGVSYNTALKLKKKGKLEDTYIQIDKTILISEQLVLNKLRNKK